MNPADLNDEALLRNLAEWCRLPGAGIAGVESSPFAAEILRRLRERRPAGEVQTNEGANAWLKAHHEEMGTGCTSGGANQLGQAHARGLAEGLHLAGLLGREEVKRWAARFDQCPEDGRHCGGQTWCAYCGNVCFHCGLREGDTGWERLGHQKVCEDPNGSLKAELNEEREAAIEHSGAPTARCGTCRSLVDARPEVNLGSCWCCGASLAPAGK